jgi:hypothetical protein
MEVHHHPHVEKKNFKEYFLEFIMIFLAVTLGFFAESYREHLQENHKEKEFIASVKEDVVSDTSFLQAVIPENQRQYDKLDSLYTLVELARNGKGFPMNRLYYLTFRYGFGLVYFSANERTISQIKSTGAFSLIKNKVCRDSVAQYYFLNDNAIPINVQGLKEWTDDLDKIAQKIFDYKLVKTFWFGGGADVFLKDSLNLEINNDRQLLKEFGNKVRSLMMMVNVLMDNEQTVLAEGKNLIAMLNKQYHL